jgi:CubicO group peptidase (beta-lactamase class C family)
MAQRKSANRNGFSADRLRHLKAVIEDDIQRGRYYGAVILVARDGAIGIHEAIGFIEPKNKKTVTKKSVFSLFSTTKAITNVLVFRAIERGEFALTTKVSEIIPEFSGGQRQNITFFHLLTHSSGLPSVFTPKPGMYIDRLDEVVAAVCENVHCTAEPGLLINYSPMAAHALLGDAVRRSDPKKRSYRQLAEDEILKPLKMKDTSIGVRKDLKPRHIVPIFLDRSPIDHLGHSNLGPNGAFEEEKAEMPWVGAISTVADMYRFAEMLRRGGELDGARILSPAILDLATRNWSGDKPNELYKPLVAARGWEPYPAYQGMGFQVRGDAVCHGLFGTLTSPRTFGNYGAGSSLFWVDPERQLTFVCLTAGVMGGVDNIERFQRLSDIAISTAV